MGRDQNDQKLWFSVRNCPCFKARLPWRSTTTWWRWEEWVFLHGKLYLIGKSKWRSTSFHGGSTDENFRLDHHRGMRIPGPEELILKFWLRDLRVTTSRKKKRSNQDLNPCDPFKSDPSLFFALVMDMCARFVLWICALEFAFKKCSIF